MTFSMGCFILAKFYKRRNAVCMVISNHCVSVVMTIAILATMLLPFKMLHVKNKLEKKLPIHLTALWCPERVLAPALLPQQSGQCTFEESLEMPSEYIEEQKRIHFYSLLYVEGNC